ncbi:MAG TPA: hypothetical protein GX714_04705 [Chloroflexi bacterium]|nr:hypothetical protein [Chloroflexota bacterium]
MKRRKSRQRRVACIWVAPRPSVEGWESGLAALEAHSPAIEEGTVEGGEAPEDGGAVAYLDARGVTPRYGSEDAWGRTVLAEMRLHVGDGARLGVAATKFAALVAARTAPAEVGYQIVMDSDSAFLAPMPVQAMPVPLSREVWRRLQILGLRTVGQFAALPETSVAEQFGPESVIVHRCARGLDDRPMVGRRRRMVKAWHEFEVPEVRREALIEAAMRLTARAMDDLPPPKEAWAIKRLQLEVRFGDGTVQRHATWLGSTPGPATVHVLWGQLVDRCALCSGTIGGAATEGVAAIGVRLVGLEPTSGKQLDLFVHTRTRLQLEQTLRLLAKKYTPACVVQANLMDAREPLMARRYRFQEYRL